jgi:ATP-dependent Clp protease ATP-binding subunit ClpX
MENVLLDSMYDLPSTENVVKVVVDEAVIDGEAAPYMIYEGNKRASGES